MRRAIGLAGIATAIVLAGGGQAHADNDTFVVDTTSDSGALNTCGVPAGDCSLRGAFANADDGDTSDVDSIDFDSTIFDGVETVPGEATITLAEDVASDEHLDVSASCAVTNPCVNIDGPAADNAISVTGGIFRMDDVAIFGTGFQGVFYGGAGLGLELEDNYFGLKFDGTVAGNDTGITVSAPNAQIGPIGHGGNVVAGNRVGVAIFGGGATNTHVHQSLFGVKPDGTLAPNTAVDIDVAGNMSGEAPSNVNIGGNANATPECDEGCNVIAAAGAGTNPRGIDMSSTSNPGGTSTASDVQVSFNFIGVNEAGTASTGATGSLVATGAADDVVVANNWMAGGRSAVAAGPDAEGVTIESNIVGTNAAGTAVLDGTSNTSININSANPGNPVRALSNTIGMDAPTNAIGVLGTGGVANNNQIGLPGVAGSGGLNAIVAGQASAVAMFGNEIANTTGDAIALLDTDDSLVASNLIGIDGPIGGAGVRVSDVISLATGNFIGGTEAANANEFGAIAGDAIQIQGDGNDEHRIMANVGGPAGSGSFIDLEGEDGPGNGAGGPNTGIEKPKVKKITERQITGIGEPDGSIWVYRSASPSGEFPDEIKKFLGTKTIKPDGSWKLKPDRNIKKSWVITANQINADGNGSELAKGKKRRK